MNPLLSSAQTWFFDSCSQHLNGTLEVSLVEGIRGAEREFVEVGDTKLGPYFPVRVLPNSRCVRVIFEHVLVWFAYDESFDTPDRALKCEDGKFLREVTASSFRQFTASTTTVATVHTGPLHEYLLNCEDRVFQVLAAIRPTVLLSEGLPDLSVERTSTWVAA